MSNACQRAEVLAGAVALSEADENEREEYRRHIAGCSSCLDELGGEVSIARIMDTVREARSSETWQPVLTSITSRNERRLRSALRFGLSAAVIAVVASLGIHALFATSIGRMAATPGNPIVLNYDGTHITLEHRPTHTSKTHTVVVAAATHLVVVHNVITLKPLAPTHAGARPTAEAKTTTTTVVAENVATSPSIASNVPIWRRGEPLPGARPAAKANPAPLKFEGRAESIALAPSQTVRDVAPLGGESAINPQPPMIAYSEGAEGTAAFAVNVDERGMPVKCTITQSSGSLVLDDAVCKAAMKAKFSPRVVNGRPVPSIYHDAFTFRNSSNNDGIPGGTVN